MTLNSVERRLLGFSNICDSASDDGNTAFVDIYNSTSNSWTVHPKGLGEGRSGLAAASLPWGLVFFAGGVTSGAIKLAVSLQQLRTFFEQYSAL